MRKHSLIETSKTATATDDLLSLFPNALRALTLLTAAGIAWQLLRYEEIALPTIVRWAFVATVSIECARWLVWPWLEKTTERDLDDSGQIGDPLYAPPLHTIEKQLVRVNVPQMTVGGVDAADLAEFIRGLPWRLTRREWTREDDPDAAPYPFRSGRLCDQAYFAQLMGIVERHGWVERGRGKSPTLLVDPTTMLQELGLDN